MSTCPSTEASSLLVICKTNGVRFAKKTSQHFTYIIYRYVSICPCVLCARVCSGIRFAETESEATIQQSECN